MIATHIDDNGVRYEFRVDGRTVFVYADCLASARKKLEDIFNCKIEIE